MNGTDATTTIETTTPEPRPWLTPKEAAAILGIDISTVYRMIENGKLRYRERPGNASVCPRFLIDPAHVDTLKTPMN